MTSPRTRWGEEEVREGHLPKRYLKEYIIFNGYSIIDQGVDMPSTDHKTIIDEYPIKDPTHDWHFNINEITPGVYVVDGIDSVGRSVSRMGTDPEKLLNLCKKDFKEILDTH